MAFAPYDLGLSRPAADFLSVLGGCGDEAKAARECEVTLADVRAYEREDGFADGRRLALEHFEGDRAYEAGRSVPPEQWPSQVDRLDLKPDPFRGSTRAGEQGFIPVSEVSDEDWQLMRFQNPQSGRPSIFQAQGAEDSFPWP